MCSYPQSHNFAAVKMPHLGEAVTEGTVTAWLKKVGEYVIADQPLVAVCTDKVDIEICSPVSGYLANIAFEADQTVLVGTELAVIEQVPQRSEDTAGAHPASDVVSTYPLAAPDWVRTVVDPTVSRWLKKENDHILEMEPVLEVTTQHGDLSVLSPVQGVLRVILIAEDSPIEPEAVMAYVEVLTSRQSG